MEKIEGGGQMKNKENAYSSALAAAAINGF